MSSPISLAALGPVMKRIIPEVLDPDTGVYRLFHGSGGCRR
ncbi:hypothetical protein ACWEQN_44330 [Streptomyces sp. NPDC004129]